jgi:hypothetical protein
MLQKIFNLKYYFKIFTLKKISIFIIIFSINFKK